MNTFTGQNLGNGIHYGLWYYVIWKPDYHLFVWHIQFFLDSLEAQVNQWKLHPSLTIQKVVLARNDLQNQNFAVLWNPNNGNETKSDIFSCDIFKFGIIFVNHKMTFIIGIFQFNCKSERKIVKKNEIKQDMCKFFPYLQRVALFIWLFEFVSWQSLSQTWVITVSKEKLP